MALTPDQEAKLSQIITAFDNGKRLNELPLVNANNPFNLICEVLDTDGESKRTNIASLLPYIEEQCAYGIEWDTAVSSPLCARIGSVALHKSLPIQNGMKGCLLSDAGTVIEYLNPTNWKGHTLDGSNGQVMVEIPAHYRKFVTSGTKRQAWLSLYPVPGYHYVHKCYISAYEAVLERSTGKLCSIINMSTNYRGGCNQVNWDGTYRSVLGRPVTNINLTAFRNAARLRKPGSTEWNCCDYNTYKAMFWLYYVEYANLNCQTNLNAAKDANGYAQGGLHTGATTLTWSESSMFNDYNPFVPCGHTDELGNMSGEVPYTIFNSNGTIFKTVYANRYRGIENAFGHIWKIIDGIIIEGQPDAYGGTSKVYVADNPTFYNDSVNNGYRMRGLNARTEGYIRELVFGEFGEIVAAVVGGGTTTYWTDILSCVEVSVFSLYSLSFGGDMFSGDYAGFAASLLLCEGTNFAQNAGSRLCFLQKTK